MPPPPANKSLGTGKDGRLAVSNLIKAREEEETLRESEAVSRKELAEKRRRHKTFRMGETLRTTRIVADKELEYINQVEAFRVLSIRL